MSVMEDVSDPNTAMIRDRRIDRIDALARPSELIAELPLPQAGEDLVVASREAVSAVLDRADDRLLVIVGPCSVHDAEAAREYAARLADKSAELSGELLIAMRVYFEKPRTTTGWKGLINDPHLDDSGDVNTGLRRARGLLLDVLELGLPVGCEFLDPIIPQYISDTVSWGAIGARTTESQVHRQLGSGLSMPVGFKNGTDGNVQIAIDAVRAAAAPHAFTGIDATGAAAILRTTGNPDGHVILRGGRDAPNYSAVQVDHMVGQLAAAGLAERVVIDASHDNSGKDPDRQRLVVSEIAEQIAAGTTEIVGVMLESFLVPGRQDLGSGDLTYGQSITDACMGWETTAEALDELAGCVSSRRGD